ncbi:MAG: nucleoside 2-deoxyribosyltransferase [Methanophagales archaeon]|nr:nucleoside 2-deoxyribosyltransferase [Methanophagales archaeon]
MKYNKNTNNVTKFVYLTCPVTYSREKILLMDKIAKILRENGWVPIVPDIDLPAKELFKRDMESLNKSSLVVAEYSDPSHGVGVETGVAYLKKIPIIGFFEKGKRISRMIKGAPHVRLIEYESDEDALNKFRAKKSG